MARPRFFCSICLLLRPHGSGVGTVVLQDDGFAGRVSFRAIVRRVEYPPAIALQPSASDERRCESIAVLDEINNYRVRLPNANIP